MDELSWERLLESAAFTVPLALALALASWWFARSRSAPSALDAPGLMVYPTSVFVLSVVCLVLCGGLFAGSLIWPDPELEHAWIIPALFSGFVAMSVWAVATCRNGRYVASPEGLRYVTWRGEEQLFRWGDLHRASYNRSMRWFVLEDVSGEKARVSAYMRGLPTFARYLLAHTPERVIAPRDLQLYRQVAMGFPPAL